MGVLMWHPETGGMFEAPTDEAVAHYRNSGWLRADERGEHEARLAEREQAAAKDTKTAKASSKEGA